MTSNPLTSRHTLCNANNAINGNVREENEQFEHTTMMANVSENPMGLTSVDADSLA